jgi:hypothetical protein
MTLKDTLDNLDDLPESVNPRELYVERDGKFALNIPGVVPRSELQRVLSSLEKERNDHKQVRERLGAWGELKPDEVLSELDRIDEYRKAAEGKLDDNQIEELVQRRLQRQVGPVQRELEKIAKERDTLRGELESMQKDAQRRTVHDEIRKAAKGAQIRESAIDDALVLGERVFEITEDGRTVTRDGVGVTPGLSPGEWFNEIQQARPHWWPEDRGAEARGSRAGLPAGFEGENPFSADGWNITAQHRFVRQYGMEKATALAKKAGTTVGGPKPQK